MRLFFTIVTFFMLLFSNQTLSHEIVLTKDNTLVLNQAVSSSSVSETIAKARELDSTLKSGYPIYLFLNTPGGSIQAGLELIEYLSGLNRPVHTISLFAASMGWQILQHLGDRYVLRYSVLMSHKASGGFQGEFGGEGSQLDSQYGMWLRRLNIMDNQTVKRTNGKKTLKKYQAEYDNELWVNGQEAVDNGYADKVVTVKCDSTLNGYKTVKKSYFGHQLSLSYDNCPIRTSPQTARLHLKTNKGLMDLDQFIMKGGVFGKKISECAKNEVCLYNPNLTFDSVIKMTNDAKNSNSNRKIIRMSFKSFVSEL